MDILLIPKLFDLIGPKFGIMFFVNFNRYVACVTVIRHKVLIDKRYIVFTQISLSPDSCLEGIFYSLEISVSTPYALPSRSTCLCYKIYSEKRPHALSR